NETITRWQGEGLNGDFNTALDLLGSDFHSLGVTWPSPFPGRHLVVSETDETEVVLDAWGATGRFWKHKSGTPEHIGFDCDSREKWEKVYKPAFVNSPIQADLDAFKEQYAIAKRAGRWIHWHAAESFEGTRKMLGDALVAVAMADDPDWVRDISQTYTDCLLRECEAVWSLGLEIDGLFMWGDMAYNRATFCSPAMYRDIIWPDHKRLADWAHAHDLKFIYHTDGNVNKVMDLYLAAGFDCLQPLEAKASMDIRRLCPQYGDRIAFQGNINVMIMMTNDHDALEEEIRSKFAAGMATQGYSYHSDHSVPPQVSLDTYHYIISLIDRYGRYD
ncbi:MAG: hypothetical protein K8I30_23735, partial [Anaerolineae bacterium]|nr:hypothetical protein [Anaerolineae bacterium]